MTAAALHADVAAPARRGWRAFLWVAALTAVWAVLTYWQPGIQASGVPLTAMRLFIYAVIALGLWLGLEHTEFSPTQRRNVWLAVIVPYTLWMALMWSAAINGAVRAAGRRRRRAHRSVCAAGGNFAGIRRHGRAQGGDRLEHLRPARFYRGDRHRPHHLARTAAIDRSQHSERASRALSDRADPGFHGAEFDPAACAVLATAVPPRAARRNGSAASGAGARLIP